MKTEPEWAAYYRHVKSLPPKDFQKFYEEEKRMKNIDFSKPLRTDVDKKPAKVIQEGLTLVEYESPFGPIAAAVDEKGEVYALSARTNFSFKVENVPEEPKD